MMQSEPKLTSLKRSCRVCGLLAGGMPESMSLQ